MSDGISARGTLLAAALCASTLGAGGALAAPAVTDGLGFAAKPVKGGIELSWRTGYLPKTLGWNVYRGRVKLNRALVFAAGRGAGRVTYRFLDRGPASRGALYRLQAVSLGGRKTWVASARR